LVGKFTFISRRDSQRLTSPRRPIRQRNLKPDPPLHDPNLPRTNHHPPKFGPNIQPSLLRNDEHITVCVYEGLVLRVRVLRVRRVVHVCVSTINVHCQALLQSGISYSSEGLNPRNEGGLITCRTGGGRDVERIPGELGS
jgi:hypothetical protein